MHNKLLKISYLCCFIALLAFSMQLRSQNALKTLEFTNGGTTGFLAGENGMLYKTSDAGNTWYNVPLNITNNLNSISSDGDYIIVVVGGGGKVVRSTNGGQTWTSFDIGLNNNLLNLNITAGGKGFIASGSSLLGSLDYGLTWNTIFTRTGTTFNSLSGYGENNLTLVGNNNFIFTSRDGALTWRKSVRPLAVHLDFQYVKMTDSLTAFTASKDGKIMRTTDGGNLWNLVYSGSDNIHCITQTKANILMASGDNGVILLSPDGGRNWNPVNSDTRASLYCMSFTDSLTGLAAGDNRSIVKTTDGGYSWNQVGYLLQTPGVIHNNEKSISLGQNYPNPFNPSTNISYVLPFSSQVTLKVYDMLGREVKSLVNAVQPAGNYNYRFDAVNLSSGIYFYVLKASNGENEITKTMRMILTK